MTTRTRRALVLLLTVFAANRLEATDLPLPVVTWLRSHPHFRLAIELDCGDCSGQIAAVRSGAPPKWPALPEYTPYYAAGDFNGDGKRDLAFAVVEETRTGKQFRLVIFNGPFQSKGGQQPAFFSEPLDLRGAGLFFGPPRPRPYRLLVGRFESDTGRLLVPVNGSYRWDDGPSE